MTTVRILFVATGDGIHTVRGGERIAGALEAPGAGGAPCARLARVGHAAFRAEPTAEATQARFRGSPGAAAAGEA